ncbi:MAG: response regulator [Acidobacteriota bacterium]
MNLSVLIVEDKEIILDDIELLIHGLDTAQRAEAGIERIEIDKANCIAAAEQFLQSAAERGSPYDLLLLDLSLPHNHDDPDNVGGGLDLIIKATRLQAARQIIIVSANVNLDTHIAESFKRGATDFIRKPYSPIELQRKILNAVRLLGERYLTKLRRLVDERIPVLSASVWKSTAHQFSSRIYDLIQAVVYESEEMRAELNLGHARAEPLLKHLDEIGNAIEDARTALGTLRKGFGEDESLSEEIVIEREVQKLAEDLQPCVTVSLLPASSGETRVLSVHDNVQTVLKEILVGGLSEAANSTRTWRAEVEASSNDGLAAIRIRDDFAPIDAKAAARINEGEHIPPEGSCSRPWGLSLAQHIALRGGGRLIVEPQDAGNLITYLIPLV